jgi:ketosteroid isomerase-like protein
MDQIESSPTRVRRLEDERDIAELFHAYAYHFDRNEPDLVAALFTEHAIIDYGPEVPPIHGRDQVVARIASGLVETFAATSHHISNISIRLQGEDAATGVAYVYAWHRYLDGAPDGHLWGQYHNQFRRTDDGWRIAALVLRAAGTELFHRLTMHPIGRD